MPSPVTKIAFSILGALGAAAAGAATGGGGQGTDDGLMGLYGDDEFVTIATGTAKPLAKAPAVASVITADEIEAMGATDLDEVLETVPGLHTSYYMTGYTPIYSIRGVYSDLNPEVLMLVNGIPLTNLFYGDRGRIWGGMPVKSIARIEVIRGPGSALYGADAFSGVINIITKSAGDIDGVEAGVRLGSFNTRAGWVQYGGDIGGFDVGFTLEAGNTDGQDSIIGFDAQAGLDFVTGTNASLAPGTVDLGRENIDMRLDVARENWRFRLGYQGRFEVESGVGGAGALDPYSRYESERWNYDLTYHNADFSDNWDVMVQASGLHVTQEADKPYQLFPPGTDFTMLGGDGPFANGVLAGPEVFEQITRVNASVLYSGFSSHHLRVGAGYEYGDLYDVREWRNFLSGPGGVVYMRPGGLVYQTDVPALFLPEADREMQYIFAQDEWAIAPDWELTLGARYDDYSDFGDTFNPRVALVWQTDYDLTTKMMYGRAFRAPAFAELYSKNNPVALGNPQLEPQTIDTVEVAFDYRPVGDWRGSLNLYAYRMKDIIRLVPDSQLLTSFTHQNSGEQDGYGMELEASWDVTKDFSLKGNLALLRAEDTGTGADAANVPGSQLYLQADWVIAPGWSANANVNWVMGRSRPLGDTRADLDDYAIANLTLRHKWDEDLDFAFSVRNIFDEDAREPGPSTGTIPNDLPLAGRSAFVELSARF